MDQGEVNYHCGEARIKHSSYEVSSMRDQLRYLLVKRVPQGVVQGSLLISLLVNGHPLIVKSNDWCICDQSVRLRKYFLSAFK